MTTNDNPGGLSILPAGSNPPAYVGESPNGGPGVSEVAAGSAAADYSATATGGPAPGGGPALVREGATVPPAPSTELKPGETRIELPSGRVALMKPYKGRQVITAQRIADGDGTMMLPALIITCTTINGAFITLEELLDELPGGDVLALFSAFNEKND